MDEQQVKHIETVTEQRLLKCLRWSSNMSSAHGALEESQRCNVTIFTTSEMPKVGNHRHVDDHKSKNGIGCVIEVATGLVIDFVILSLYCHSGAGAVAHYGGEETAAYKKWKDGHTDCNCNYSGSS